MAKKFLSALLAVFLCAGLAFPAAALEYEDEDRPRRIKLSNTSMRMEIDEVRYLSATVSPNTADDTVTWESSNSAVADVDDSGKVTANDAGSCIITVKTINNLKATCRIEVRSDTIRSQESVYRVEISPEKVTVRVGQTRQLIAYVYPRDLDEEEKYITWSTRDARIAEIDQDGTVKGISEGTTYVTATSGNGKSTTCEVTVSAAISTSSSKASTTSAAGQTATSGDGQVTDETVRSAVNTAVRNRTGYASFRGVSSISSTALSAAASAAGSNTVLLRFATAGKDGKQYAYLSVDPKKVKDGIRVGVSVDSQAAASVKSTFDRYYKNQTAVIYCAQTGTFGAPVTIHAKADLSGMNKDNLKFYSYNPETKRIQELKITNYTVDKNGYLAFSTPTGNAIIVSEGALAKK